MDRRYMPLQPSKGSAPPPDHTAPTLKPEVGPLKRRRVGVAIACNACRQKKVRCDGQRPQCSNCRLRTASKCEYRDDEALLSKESKEIITEIVTILNQLPTLALIQTIRSLKEEESPATALSILRDASGPESQVKTPADSSVSTPAPGDTTTAVTDGELELQYPAVYQGLEKAPHMLQREPYRGLTEPTSQSRPAPLSLCDSRLDDLDIHYWTNVSISNGLAARCISLYLETDHPLLCLFDPKLFVSDLTSGQTKHCSSLLVNALLYWACQMYCAIEPQADELAMPFCEEAERLWNIERENSCDSTLNMEAAVFLCLGYLGQGRDHAVLKYLAEVTGMGTRLGSFGVEGEQITDDVLSSDVYAAWGVFNWTVLMSLFYHQPGIHIPAFAPRVQMPHTNPVAPYMGHTFPYLCRFWNILHEVGTLYHADGTQPWGASSSPSFAEFKYRELLAWSNRLPYRLISEQGNPHHVEIMHIWFHAAVLDLFRPLVHDASKKSQPLRTFATLNYTPQVIYTKSTMQLKSLIVDYRLNYVSSSTTFLWHTALTYVANAILDGEYDKNWYFYMLFCFCGYQQLSKSWRVGRTISKALLSMMLKKGRITSSAARKILKDVEGDGTDAIPENIRATFMGDLGLSLTWPGYATVEHLAGSFEENAVIQDYTNLFDEEGQRQDGI